MSKANLDELKCELQKQLAKCADWSALVKCNGEQFRSEVRAAIASLLDMRDRRLDEEVREAVTAMVIADIDMWESR